jgi:hypothetical protein
LRGRVADLQLASAVSIQSFGTIEPSLVYMSPCDSSPRGLAAPIKSLSSRINYNAPPPPLPLSPPPLPFPQRVPPFGSRLVVENRRCYAPADRCSLLSFFLASLSLSLSLSLRFFAFSLRSAIFFGYAHSPSFRSLAPVNLLHYFFPHINLFSRRTVNLSRVRRIACAGIEARAL